MFRKKALGKGLNYRGAPSSIVQLPCLSPGDNKRRRAKQPHRRGNGPTFHRLEPCMKHPRPTRRALLLSLGLLHGVAFASWQILPPGRDRFATVTVNRGDIESSVTALGTLQPRR